LPRCSGSRPGVRAEPASPARHSPFKQDHRDIRRRPAGASGLGGLIASGRSTSTPTTAFVVRSAVNRLAQWRRSGGPPGAQPDESSPYETTHAPSTTTATPSATLRSSSASSYTRASQPWVRPTCARGCLGSCRSANHDHRGSANRGPLLQAAELALGPADLVGHHCSCSAQVHP
jgi:hypothetical protein